MQTLKEFIELFLQPFVSTLLGREEKLEVVPITDPSFGHYQLNSLFSWAKEKRMPPRLLGEKLLELIKTGDSSPFSSITLAGAGFLNFTFSPSFLSAHLQSQLQDGSLGVRKKKDPQKVMVEFSSPNIAKELHVGHLRSTIIGDCIARILEFLGEDVERISHVGDWGTQFGMLIALLKQEKISPDQLALEDLMLLYQQAKKLFDEDPVFKEKAQKEVVFLQKGEKENLELWKKICTISRQGYEEIYKLLDVHLKERGESFYNPFLAEVVKDLEDKGLVTLSDGAKCIFLTEFKGREEGSLFDYFKKDS